MASALWVASLQSLYLFAPLLVSAALSGLVLRFDRFRFLRRPIDHGATYRGRRVFGNSKTWRGVAVAVVGSMVSVWLQRAIQARIPASLQIVDYARVDPVSFGAAMGLGAMLGELPNSFVKRQLGIAPGGTGRGWCVVIFYVWDQVDPLTGAWPLMAIWIHPSASVVVASFGVAMALHPLIALIGYVVGARASPR